MSIETDLAIIKEALLDHAPGPLPEHDPMCRALSGWPNQKAKGCNCSVSRNVTARDALVRITAIIEGRG